MERLPTSARNRALETTGPMGEMLTNHTNWNTIQRIATEAHPSTFPCLKHKLLCRVSPRKPAKLGGLGAQAGIHPGARCVFELKSV